MNMHEVQTTLNNAKYAIENGTHYSENDLKQLEQLTKEIQLIYKVLKARLSKVKDA